MTEQELIDILDSGNTEQIAEQYDKIRRKLSQIDSLKRRGIRLTKDQQDEFKLLNKYYSEYDDKVAETNKKLEEQRKSYEKINKSVDSIKKGISGLWRDSVEMLNAWGKADQAVANFMKSVGGSALGMRQLRKEVIDLVANSNLAVKFGVDTEKMMKMMSSYTSSIGRNVQASREGMKNLAAMSAIFGDQKASDFVSKLENFGVSMQEAGRRSGQMFSSAAKHGVSFEAYSKNFLDNIQLAQRYTFKDGLEGLSNMARKSTEIQLSLQQSANFAEKVSTLEGAIGVGAQLQVLGGAFSAMSNPLELLNEGITDFEGLQDRIADMIGGFGKFNKETGEVEVSSTDRIRLKAAAQASGMDYAEVMKSVYSQGRRNELAKALADRGDLSEDMKSLIKNIGSFENGVAGVNVRGKFKSIEELTNEDQTALIEISRTESDDIKDIAVRLRGWEDTMTGAKKQIEASKAQLVESSGIGDNVKNLVTTVTSMNSLLKWYVLGVPALKAASRIGRGGWGLIKSGKSLGGYVEDYGKENWGFSPKGLIAGKWGRGASRGAKIGGAVAGVAIGGGILASGISSTSQHDQLRKSGQLQRGTIESNSARTGDMLKTWGGAGATIGSAIGSIFGPLGSLAGLAIGGLVGGIGGGIHSAIKNSQDKKALAAKEKISQNYGLSLSGDYRNKDMKAITRALADDGEISLAEFRAMNKRMQEQLLRSGDIDQLVKDKDVLEAIKSKYESMTIESKDTNMNVSGDIYINGDKVATQKGATGGLLVGPSHANGGMRIAHSNIEVEGGEFVVNKNATRKNIDLLTRINSSGDSIIKPRQMANGGMLTVAPTVGGNNGAARRMEMKPIDVNINGSIKLEGMGSQSVDMMKTLLENPSFVKEIAALIQKEIAIKADGGLIINKGLK